MTVVYARVELLRRRRTELVKEQESTMAVLGRFQEDERQQDRTSKLSSLLRSHLYPAAGEQSQTTRVNEYEPAGALITDEVTAWLPSMPSAPRRDVTHPGEANAAWDLRKVALRVEGADSLLARVSDDLRLVRQTMDQVRERRPAKTCRLADREPLHRTALVAPGPKSTWLTLTPSWRVTYRCVAASSFASPRSR